MSDLTYQVLALKAQLQQVDQPERNPQVQQLTTLLQISEKELIKYIKVIVRFEKIDRNIILNLIDNIEIIDKENIKIYYKFRVD